MKILDINVDDIMRIVAHILVNQSSIAIDFIVGDGLEDWRRTNEKFMQDQLALLKSHINLMERKPINENII